nr:hypothetical protein [Tanacetum cinerariifolium]
VLQDPTVKKKELWARAKGLISKDAL